MSAPAAGVGTTQIIDDIAAWKASLERRGRDPRYVKQAVQEVTALVEFAGWPSAADARTRDIERWLGQVAEERGIGGTTQNKLLGYASSFLGWCAKNERAADNPARRVGKALELREGATARSPRRRPRR